jgi:hypothetical protein
MAADSDRAVERAARMADSWIINPHATTATIARQLQGDAVLRLLAEEDRIPAVREMTDAGRAWHRDWVERTFAPLLAGMRGAARVVATDLLVWKLLRREMGLGRPMAERIVLEMVTATKGTL